MITLGVFVAGLILFSTPGLALWVAIVYLTSD